MIGYWHLLLRNNKQLKPFKLGFKIREIGCNYWHLLSLKSTLVIVIDDIVYTSVAKLLSVKFEDLLSKVSSIQKLYRVVALIRHAQQSYVDAASQHKLWRATQPITCANVHLQ